MILAQGNFFFFMEVTAILILLMNKTPSVPVVQIQMLPLVVCTGSIPGQGTEISHAPWSSRKKPEGTPPFTMIFVLPKCVVLRWFHCPP